MKRYSEPHPTRFVLFTKMNLSWERREEKKKKHNNNSIYHLVNMCICELKTPRTTKLLVHFTSKARQVLMVRSTNKTRLRSACKYTGNYTIKEKCVKTELFNL